MVLSFTVKRIGLKFETERSFKKNFMQGELYKSSGREVGKVKRIMMLALNIVTFSGGVVYRQCFSMRYSNPTISSSMLEKFPSWLKHS